ncbi:hypothetical protein EW146_g1200 [Bondarzewia mesenterica]|uniref:DUF4246 domain-containing protein n=1 Tax=Bondarzewia mesenterica TaxID=1095465 RepID=A0A4S4M6Y0_9AGAM|nr:hypothetical protein EW146_g1200 [Bondarzewia mesenterica]
MEEVNNSGYPNPFFKRVSIDLRLTDAPQGQEQDIITSMLYSPNWNGQIMERWRQEAADQQLGLPIDERLTYTMIDYVLSELEGYSRLTDPETGIQYACDDYVFCSHRLLSEGVVKSLRTESSRLENVPENEKDWHPRSNQQVLDRTDDPKMLRPLSPPSQNPDDVFTSMRFAWLPSDFLVSEDGVAHLISPYINNLHPSNQELYNTLVNIFGSFVPMWERVLGAVASKQRMRCTGNDKTKTKGRNGRIQNVSCIWKHIGRGEIPYDPQAVNNHYAEYPGRTWQQRRRAWVLSWYPLNLPEAPERYQGELETSFRRVNLRGMTLQCIIKLVNIHLTPENPKYSGGSWHVEGMLNERIVATGLYKISLNRAWCSAARSPTAPQYHLQYDNDCMQILYDIDELVAPNIIVFLTINTHDLNSEDDLIQERGNVVTYEGLALAFPNIYQHRVSPFELLDPTNPGHRKIVAFFLVDPNHRIPSATNVPPQQEDWITKAISTSSSEGSVFARLPVELEEMVIDKVEGLMNR